MQLPSIIGTDQVKGTQAAKTREKQEISDNAEAKKQELSKREELKNN